jgi:hypothetical protein
MYAYMLWADVTAGIMKMRNGANSAWISLWELDGTFIATDISLSAGTAGAPSLYFTGDTNTGIYSPGADQVAVSTGGSGRLFIDASGRVGVGVSAPSELVHLGSGGKLRFNRADNTTGTTIHDGGNAGFIFNSLNNDPFVFQMNGTEKVRIQAVTGNVGIGTSSPAYALHVSTTSVPAIGAFRALDVASVGTAGQEIYFGALNGSTPTPGASITGRLDNPATTGDLAFSTRSGGTLSTRMFISSGGNVGIQLPQAIYLTFGEELNPEMIVPVNTLFMQEAIMQAVEKVELDMPLVCSI